jgi:hypothetical protein
MTKQNHQTIEINKIKNKEYFNDDDDDDDYEEGETSDIEETYVKSDNYSANYNNCLKIYKNYSTNNEKSKTMFMFGNKIFLLPHTIGLYIFILIIIFILSTILRIKFLLYLAISPIVFYFSLTILNLIIFFYNFKILNENSENFIYDVNLEKRILKMNFNQISEDNLMINENCLNKHVDFIRNKFINGNNENLVIIFYNGYYLKNIKTKTLFHLFIHFLINFLALTLCIILVKIV